MHLSDEMQTNLYDLHADGTSRDKKSYVGQQVTLENKKSLSYSFHRVSTETRWNCSDSHTWQWPLLQKSLLSPQTLMMKCKPVLSAYWQTWMQPCLTLWQGQCHESIQQRSQQSPTILGTETGLDFLYCWADILLGLSTAADKALSEAEQRNRLQNNLGWDKMAAFGHFQKSAAAPAALQALRTSYNILGPHGDEKSGCRDSWIGFCSLQGVQSRITSFRGNQFNNTFEPATGVIHHLKQLKEKSKVFKYAKLPSKLLTNESLVWDL